MVEKNKKMIFFFTVRIISSTSNKLAADSSLDLAVSIGAWIAKLLGKCLGKDGRFGIN